MQHRALEAPGMGFPVAQMVRNLSAMQETWVRSLGRGDPLEEGLATHSSILFFFKSYLFVDKFSLPYFFFIVVNFDIH